MDYRDFIKRLERSHYGTLHRALSSWVGTDFPLSTPHHSNVEMPR